MSILSIIVPVYNETDNIRPFYDALLLSGVPDFELIWVDDGSTDNTLLEINSLAAADNRVKCVSLSRNFDHQNALLAGMQYAKGNVIITMDGDLQHPPSAIPGMIQKLEEGFDIVSAKRIKTEKTGWLKNVTAYIFYRFINFISTTRIEENVSDFRAFNKKVLSNILLIQERQIFLRGIFSWIGFRQTTIEYNAPVRRFGSTKYSPGKMFRLALHGTLSFSFRPLRLSLLLGLIISLFAFLFAIYALIQHFRGNTVVGWTSIIITCMLLGGIQLLVIGLLGEYVAGLFTEVKQRPRFIVNETINL